MVLAIVMVGGCVAHAQQDSSLTRLFDGMSAKERSRIAKQEQEESAKDAKYQAMMEQGDALFREQRFDEALAAYQSARQMRPYNVYPKVRIQDLQALIARKQAEEAQVTEQSKPEAPPVPEPAIPVVQEKAQEPREEVQPLPSQVEERPVPASPRQLPPPGPVPEPAKSVATPTAMRAVDPQPARHEAPAADPLPDGVQERIFKEGRSVVVERTVVEEGRSTIYRKVLHPWGGAAWFKDAIAISERAWDEVFGR